MQHSHRTVCHSVVRNPEGELVRSSLGQMNDRRGQAERVFIDAVTGINRHAVVLATFGVEHLAESRWWVQIEYRPDADGNSTTVTTNYFDTTPKE